ncbi:MAG: TIM barrel protein [Trueperaceae bacterium]|nr:TIM barrel protein [Trueperaceae bacterium]
MAGTAIRVANAPCSWGSIEGFGETTPWPRMLDELVATGYVGTELGDLGYLPDQPAALRAALEARGLAMLGGFEGVELRRPGIVKERRERILRVARLLASVADVGDPGRPPYFILADETRGDPVRTLHAGRITPELALPAGERAVFARNAEEVARLVAGETGLRTLYHHHCAAWVETPDEIERFLDATNPELIGLVFDTGHFTYGTGAADDGGAALAGLKRFWGRTPYVHLKDCDPVVAGRARVEGWDYGRAIGEGVFCELGRGSVDIAGVLAYLRAAGYDDWLTVEQDVLPGMGTPKESAARNRATVRALGL